MKVVLINTFYSPNIIGGAERSTQFLAEALVREGHEAIVLSTVDHADSTVDHLNGVKVYYIGIKNLYWQYEKHHTKERSQAIKLCWHAIDIYNPLMAGEVGRILDHEQPDLVHTSNLAGFSVAVWDEVKKRNLPLVHTIRDYYLLCPRKSIMFRNGKSCDSPCWDCSAYAAPKRHYSDRVDAVVGVSQYVLDRHLSLDFFARSPIKTAIYNSYDAPSRCHDPHSPLRFGYLGRLEEMKGFHQLLKHLTQLPTEGWELHVGGQVSQEELDYFQTHYPLPNIHYLGFIKPDDFFSEVDVLIVPSLWQEPLGRTVLEAYAHGVPVIGSNRGGIPEIIEPGRTGFIFDPDQAEILLAAINQFIQNPDLIRQMRKNIVGKYQTFTSERILEAYLGVYQAAIEQVSQPTSVATNRSIMLAP